MAEDMAKQNQNKVSISYYRWEGDPCRMLEDEAGNITADIYRAGRGNVPINETDLMFYGIKISEKEYKDLVLEEIALNKKNEG